MADPADRPTGQPTADELAAIVAAVKMAWPRPVVVVPSRPEGPAPWRFSGRWWSRPMTVRRERPWIERTA